jgi:prophage DNA circulation protein
VNGLADITAALDDLDAAVGTIIYTPTALANSLMSVVRSVVGLADHTQDTIDAASGLPSTVAASATTLALSASVRQTQQASIADLGSDAPEVGGTGLAQREADNTRAVYRVARAEGLARAVETYADAAFDSSTLALAVLKQTNAEIDALAGYSATDDLFAALQDLRAALVEHLTVTASQLPSVRRMTRYPSVPAILLAHELFGDASLEAELVARNQPRCPTLMDGDVTTLFWRVAPRICALFSCRRSSF